MEVTSNFSKTMKALLSLQHTFCCNKWQCADGCSGEHCPVCNIPAHARDCRVHRQLSNISSLSVELGRLLLFTEDMALHTATCVDANGVLDDSDQHVCDGSVFPLLHDTLPCSSYVSASDFTVAPPGHCLFTSQQSSSGNLSTSTHPDRISSLQKWRSHNCISRSTRLVYSDKHLHVARSGSGSCVNHSLEKLAVVVDCAAANSNTNSSSPRHLAIADCQSLIKTTQCIPERCDNSSSFAIGDNGIDQSAGQGSLRANHQQVISADISSEANTPVVAISGILKSNDHCFERQNTLSVECGITKDIAHQHCSDILPPNSHDGRCMRSAVREMSFASKYTRQRKVSGGVTDSIILPFVCSLVASESGTEIETIWQSFLKRSCTRHRLRENSIIGGNDVVSTIDLAISEASMPVSHDRSQLLDSSVHLDSCFKEHRRGGNIFGQGKFCEKLVKKKKMKGFFNVSKKYFSGIPSSWNVKRRSRDHRSYVTHARRRINTPALSPFIRPEINKKVKLQRFEQIGTTFLDKREKYNLSKTFYFSEKPLQWRRSGQVLSKKCAEIPIERSTGSERSVAVGTKRNAKGETPLHLAAIKGDLLTVQKLLESGSDPNTKDNAGWTPLHEAVNHGDFAVARLLLQFGSLANMPGMHNLTPLHDAAINGHVECVQLLLDYGATTSARNMYGKTPIDVAKTPEVVSALRQPPSTVQQLPPSLPNVRSVGYHHNHHSVCLLRSALSSDQRPVLQKCALAVNGKVVEEYCSEVTHTVIGVNGNGQCPRTLKYLHSVLAGNWIVSIGWIKACLEYRKKLAEEPFEIPGTSTHPNCFTPKRARLNQCQQMPPLFDGCQVYLHGSFTNQPPSKHDLTSLLRLGGARILSREPRPPMEVEGMQELTVPYHAVPGGVFHGRATFVVHDGCVKLDKLTADNILCLPGSWVVDCIALFSLVEPV